MIDQAGMMNGWAPATQYNVKPRARRRRRRVLRLGLAALLLAGLGVLAWYYWDPPPLPEQQIERGRAAFRQAQNEAAKLAPAELQRASVMRLVMERLVAEERARLIRFRRPEALEHYALELEKTSKAAIAAAGARRASLLRDSAQRRTQLEARLNALAADVETMPGEKLLQRAYSRAQIKLEQVRKLEREKRTDKLMAEMNLAAQEISAAEEILDERLGRLHNPTLQRRWQSWADATIAASRERGTAIVVDKLRRRCVVLRHGRAVAQYKAEFGRNGLSDKLHAGDGATPEGRYQVTSKKSRSRFFKALVIDYPNRDDLAEYSAARRRGLVPRGHGPGSLIEIHGNGGKGTNWTDGCVALRDNDMERLFQTVDIGTPVTIVGAARLPGD